MKIKLDVIGIDVNNNAIVNQKVLKAYEDTVNKEISFYKSKSNMYYQQVKDLQEDNKELMRQNEILCTKLNDLKEQLQPKKKR